MNINSVNFESPRAHSPLLAAGLASKNINSYGIEESSWLAARFFKSTLYENKHLS